MGTPLYRKSLMIVLSTLCLLTVSVLHVQAEINIVATTEHYGAHCQDRWGGQGEGQRAGEGKPESACR